MSALPRVLVVEDDTDVLEIIRLALEEIGGLQVTTCTGGTAALDEIRKQAPDLVLLDVMMPEMDGPTFFARLRALDTTRDTPVVFVTAKVAPDELARLRRLGAAGVITKPFDPVELPGQVLEIWRAVQPASRN